MIEQKDINSDKANSLYWRYVDWLKEVRLNSEERDEIETIVRQLTDIITNND